MFLWESVFLCTLKKSRHHTENFTISKSGVKLKKFSCTFIFIIKENLSNWQHVESLDSNYADIWE